MSFFRVGDKVITSRRVKAGHREDGPIVCEAGVRGEVIKIERDEWDGVLVQLAPAQEWWFKPGQLVRVEDT
jgi:hypothetical protein